MIGPKTLFEKFSVCFFNFGGRQGHFRERFCDQSHFFAHLIIVQSKFSLKSIKCGFPQSNFNPNGPHGNQLIAELSHLEILVSGYKIFEKLSTI